MHVCIVRRQAKRSTVSGGVGGVFPPLYPTQYIYNNIVTHIGATKKSNQERKCPHLYRRKQYSQNGSQEANGRKVVIAISDESDAEDQRNHREVGHARVGACVDDAVEENGDERAGRSHDLVERHRDEVACWVMVSTRHGIGGSRGESMRGEGRRRQNQESRVKGQGSRVKPRVQSASPCPDDKNSQGYIGHGNVDGKQHRKRNEHEVFASV